MALADNLANAVRPLLQYLTAGVPYASGDLLASVAALIAYDISVGTSALDGPTLIEDGQVAVDLAHPASPTGLAGEL